MKWLWWMQWKLQTLAYVMRCHFFGHLWQYCGHTDGLPNVNIDGKDLFAYCKSCGLRVPLA